MTAWVSLRTVLLLPLEPGAAEAAVGASANVVAVAVATATVHSVRILLKQCLRGSGLPFSPAVPVRLMSLSGGAS